MGVSEELYLSLDEPPTSDHLWRYTPWKKIHPTGDYTENPGNVRSPKVNLSYVDGEPVKDVTLEAGKEVKRLYIEEASEISKEYYLSCLIDRQTSKIAFISSKEGGMEIE